MPDIDPVVILVATVVCFALGAVYYAVLGTRLAELSGTAGSDVKAPPWALVVEVLRCLVLAAVVAGLAAHARVDGLTGGLVLGLILWIGFPVVLWIGAIVHENIRWRLAAIHAGDWLVKLLVVGAVVSAWP
jgi:amino acid permease